MPRLAGVLAAAFLAAFGACAATAQDEVPSVVVIDQERLFQESLLGQRITQDLEERSDALAAENRGIEAELVAEERALTERRAELDADEFRALADAFDDKVERLRAEQDAKTRELVTVRDAGRQNFTQLVGPVLLDYMRRTGAAVMIDRRSVVATSDRADVTDELIAEVDARVGAGEDADPSEVTGGDAVEPPGEGAGPAGEGAPLGDDARDPLSMPQVGGSGDRPPVGGPPTVPAPPE